MEGIAPPNPKGTPRKSVEVPSSISPRPVSLVDSLQSFVELAPHLESKDAELFSAAILKLIGLAQSTVSPALIGLLPIVDFFLLDAFPQ